MIQRQEIAQLERCDWLLIINSGALNHRLAEASVLSITLFMQWRSQIKHFVGLTEFCQFMNPFYKHNGIYDSV